MGFKGLDLLVLILITSCSLLRTEPKEFQSRKTPKVFLTVSSLTIAPHFELRKVVINYYDAECERMLRSYPFIGLYDRDLKQDIRNPLLIFKPTDCPEGSLSTNYTFPYVDFTAKDLSSSKCLKYWVAYIEAGSIVHSNCIQTNPNWMSNMKHQIGHMTMNCLMIPGTHDSGLYFKYNRLTDTVFQKYMYTQEESIYNQLVYGIRFLDLRVWHEGSYLWKSTMQITHDKFHLWLPLLDEVLEDVKRFVEGTNEFVIIDFHRLFSGHLMTKTLDRWQHKEIVEELKQKFGKLIIENVYADVPLNKLWSMNKRVLITYNNRLNSPEGNYVTYPVIHWWNGAADAKHLHEYLVDNACSLPYYSSAAVAVLTPTMWTPLTDATYSRRKTADEVNSLINKWFRNELLCSNVVITDYFLGNNVIQIAIEANKNKSRCDIFWSYYDMGLFLLTNDE